MNAPANPPTSKLAIWSLVLAFLCAPIGLVMAIVALVKIGDSKGQLGGKGLAIAALVIPLMCVPTSGILAAIAIPNFIKFQCRSMQSEAKVTLSGLSVSQEAFHMDQGRYGTLEEIGFSASGGRYRYELVDASADAWTARAVGTTDVVVGDVWEVGKGGSPSNVDNACGGGG
jgi:type IV pilus assembly protein PilA